MRSDENGLHLHEPQPEGRAAKVTLCDIGIHRWVLVRRMTDLVYRCARCGKHKVIDG